MGKAHYSIKKEIKMNKVIISSLLLIFSFAMNANVKDDFKEANKLYSEADYETAKTSYLSLLETGHYSAELYYNLGNTYFKLGELASAILYFEKAKKLNPLDEDIHHNLNFSYNLTVDKNDNLEDEILSAWWGTLVKYQPLNRWALYSVLLFFLAAVLVVLFFFVNQRIQKQLSFYGALVSLVCFVCVLFIGFQSKKLIEETTHGIVFQPSVTILGEPNASGTKLFTLHEGAKVELLNQEGNWQRIRFSKEKIGWVKTEVVQGI